MVLGAGDDGPASGVLDSVVCLARKAIRPISILSANKASAMSFVPVMSATELVKRGGVK